MTFNILLMDRNIHEIALLHDHDMSYLIQMKEQNIRTGNEERIGNEEKKKSKRLTIINNVQFSGYFSSSLRDVMSY
jgi:hypothetical protein